MSLSTRCGQQHHDSLTRLNLRLQVGIYKVVRNLAGIAVNQVKDFTASLPKVVLEGAAKADAEKGAAELKEAGAKVKVA